MDAMNALSSHVMARFSELHKMKSEGCKIVGYIPTGYVPEELVLACGAVPVGLIRGGDHTEVELAGAYVPRWLDTFCRAQIGYLLSQSDPLYEMIDTLVVSVTDTNIRAIAECCSCYTDMPVFTFGVPHTMTEDGFKYYLAGIARLKDKLEEMTGIEITSSRLKESIELCNKEKELLREISLTRRSHPSLLKAKDFIGLHHASFLVDKGAMVGVLKSLLKELKQKVASPSDGPRLLLTGSSIAFGDDKVLDLIEQCAGQVVIEEFSEGIRPYWWTVQPNGNLMEALADCYFRRRVHPAWFRPGRERLDFLVKLAKDFDVAGVIWYQMMYRDSYDIEAFYFRDILQKETGLSMLTIESDYDPGETEVFRNRIETFIDSLRR